MVPWIDRRSLSAKSSIAPPNSAHLCRRLSIQLTPRGVLVSGQSSTAGVLIGWGKEGIVEKVELCAEEQEAESIIVVDGGIAGLLRGFSNSYLIMIMESDLVATLLDPPRTILSPRKLLSIPLEHSAANAALAPYRDSNYAGRKANVASSVTDSDSTDGDSDDQSDGEVEGLQELGLGPSVPSSAVPELAEGKQPVPARKLWDRLAFYPRPPIPPPPPPPPSISPSPSSTYPPTFTNTSESNLTSTRPSTPGEVQLATSRRLLDAKILRELLVILSEGMYFSFDFDITTSLQRKHALSTSRSNPASFKLKSNDSDGPAEPAGLVEPLSHLPLWRNADKRFFFNKHLQHAFIQIEASSYIVVLQQGFVSQAIVPLPIQSYVSEPISSAAPSSVALSLLLISRRSTERPGFRYQRRGASPEGAVANFVESEFIVAAERGGKQHVASFVQTRGSIPIFWSQSPWALKPPPVLERTPEERLAALTNHFTSQINLYGKQIIVNLAEKTGKEAAVVEAYRTGVAQMGKEELVKYVEFDFHHECKGMHYENINHLTDELQQDLEDLSYFWTTGDEVFTSQQGVVRTNCIDCLDRTNVVQSALSRWALNRHLVHLGITTQEEFGQHDELDACFNNMWADNGDFISREYAGTSALKGDFTRTGKRDLRGQINDATNSMARLLRSTTSDFFRQAVVDFVLGRNLNAFVEFQQNLISSDPGTLIQLAKIRAEAIETASLMLLQEGEELIGGWTLLSPQEPDLVRSTKFIERVLLLSNKAVYCVEYDYTLQKVMSYTRIPTGDVLGLRTGPYILSALDGAGQDPVENYGFLLKFNGQAALDRVNTSSVRIKTSSRLAAFPSGEETKASPLARGSHYFAFRAIRGDGNEHKESGRRRTAMDTVEDITSVLTEACEIAGAVEPGDSSWIEKKPIISLEEAQASTPYLQKISHSLKSLIWL